MIVQYLCTMYIVSHVCLGLHDRKFVESTWLQLIREKAQTPNLPQIKPREDFELQTSRQQRML